MTANPASRGQVRQVRRVRNGAGEAEPETLADEEPEAAVPAADAAEEDKA